MDTPGASVPRIAASVAMREAPAWAVLQRRLFDLLDTAWREFESKYCGPDGRLVYSGAMHHRDGVDDFYEPFFNWPVLYRLGGSDDLLPAVKHHWTGVTAQMTEFGFVRDEYELGYDWFHQGESLIFFYAICAADPDDPDFRERARRFARLYSDPASGNYDPGTRIIVAPHTGSGGPRPGLGTEWIEYSATQTGMRPYGLPLQDIDGIHEWDDLAVGDNAQLMGDQMQARLGHGDTAVNLAATSLVTNAWLYDHDADFSSWVMEYVDAWRARAAENGGLVPDNVGPNGVVGELQNGHWYGGHYGWQWPHGLSSVESAVMIAAVNESIISGSTNGLEFARIPIDTVIAKGVPATGTAAAETMGWGWVQKTGVTPEATLQLVPYRHGPDGWFDFNPVPLVYPVWLWWLTGDDADRDRLASIEAESGFDWRSTNWFHDKEEQGHEAPWLSFLFGRNETYPEDALELALGQVTRRIGLMRQAPHGPFDDDIHWWQRLNPVVTEVLTQLTTGAPPALYNGGLSLARVMFGDARRGRPGLPEGVAALVSRVDKTGVRLQLVNLSGDAPQEVVVQSGAFGEDRIDSASFDVDAGSYPGDARSYLIPTLSSTTAGIPVNGNRVVVELPPLSTITVDLEITRRAFTPAHRTFSEGRR
ncbi:MAG TPA: hypothetical protein VHZ81_07110 [Galbitalea sp.]|jgi:hypothetical protein|nr:hypothetical protein [Galbitalea sp.]